ncbi:MAG TPA: serine/threonine-protein kinase [Opitutaceae bacterium]
MPGTLIDVSADDRAQPSARPSAQEDPRERHPLSGIESCVDLPEREDLGPPLEVELAPGHVLDGRYVIREAVGRSGMATIYRADDRRGGGVVAVKVPLMRIESDPVSFGRFQREERIGCALSDTLLLRFIPPDTQRSRPYIVTEYLDGCTLSLVLHRARRLPERDALRIASVICQALGQMHRRRIIHRDLKPGNLMVCRDQRLCLMDFGLAAEIKEGSGFLSGLTPLFGTPEYMAPEQVRNAHNDERTDIYSLGVILYQMLTGVLPFEHEDPWAAAQLRVTGDPVAPRAVNPGLSAEAEEIVLHAMRRKPAERYQTVEAFRADLDAPGRVHVTGLSGRLQKPHWRMSLQGTPILSGIIIGVSFLAFLVGLFLFLVRH